MTLFNKCSTGKADNKNNKQKGCLYISYNIIIPHFLFFNFAELFFLYFSMEA